MEAFKAPDITAFRRNIEEAANGTFKWFLEEQAFLSWTAAKHPSFLLIRGAPGQGKTVLSKFLLGHLESENTLVQKNRLVVYFFCSDRDDSLKTVNSILRSLVKQLMCGSTRALKVLSSFEPNLAKALDSNDTLWDMFEAALKDSDHSEIYCLLDGLDELEKDSDRKETTKLLKRLRTFAFTSQAASTSHRQPILKVIGTSRPMPEILDPLEGLTCFDLQAHLEDLKIFVDQRVSALPTRFSEDLRKQAAELLLAKAERTFLWVSIVVRRLEAIRFPSIAGLKETIEASSTHLDSLYENIFRQLEECPKVEQQLVVWVVYGKRPLTLRELEAALATQIDSKNEEATKDHKITLTPETLANILGVILESTPDGVVHLIHQSAKEFILNRNLFKAAFGSHRTVWIY
jgi:hypothetical protein